MSTSIWQPSSSSSESEWRTSRNWHARRIDEAANWSRCRKQLLRPSACTCSVSNYIASTVVCLAYGSSSRHASYADRRCSGQRPLSSASAFEIGCGIKRLASRCSCRRLDRRRRWRPLAMSVCHSCSCCRRRRTETVPSSVTLLQQTWRHDVSKI